MNHPTLSLIASFIGMFFVICAYLMRKKSMYLVCQSLCLGFLIISYFFQMEFFVMIGVGIGLMRSLTFFMYEQKDKNAPIIWSFVFSIATLASYLIINLGILKTAKPLDILSIISLAMYAFIFRIRSLKIVRFTMLVPTIISIIYNVLLPAMIFTTLTYVFELVVNCISIVRFHVLPWYTEKYGHALFVPKRNIHNKEKNNEQD